jgi:hypothetical protein
MALFLENLAGVARASGAGERSPAEDGTGAGLVPVGDEVGGPLEGPPKGPSEDWPPAHATSVIAKISINAVVRALITSLE